MTPFATVRGEMDHVQGWIMRDIGVIAASVVGFLVLAVFLARGAGGTAAAVDDKVQIGQLQAELSGARAELEKTRAELKQAQENGEALRKRVGELEKQAAKKK